MPKSHISAAATIVKNRAISFFEARYPLVRLFPYGNDILLYDAKPHIAFLVSGSELEVLVDYLRPLDREALANKYTSLFGNEYLAAASSPNSHN